MIKTCCNETDALITTQMHCLAMDDSTNYEVGVCSQGELSHCEHSFWTFGDRRLAVRNRKRSCDVGFFVSGTRGHTFVATDCMEMCMRLAHMYALNHEFCDGAADKVDTFSRTQGLARTSASLAF